MTDVPSESLTRPSLLVRIRDPQDAVAWKSFVATYAPLVLGYCRKRGLQGADADDVTQEVFAKISGTIGRFEYQPERGRFRDWLGAVTHGEICRFMTRKSRGGRAAGGPDGDREFDSLLNERPGNDWTDAFHAHILSKALEQIRPLFEAATWDAFDLVWLQEKRSADAAKELSIPLESVYVAKSRVLKRLREKVLELAEEIPSSFASR